MTPAALRHLLRTSPTIAPVPHRALLYVHGSQASEFLNGILATTVKTPPKGPFFSAFLHAQGRVLHDVFIYPKKDIKQLDGYVIEYDSRPSEAPPLLPSLKRYILRSKVKIEDVTNEYDVWSIWGSENERKWEVSRQWNWARSGVIEPAWPADDAWPWGTDEDSLHDRRAVGMGKRAIIPKGSKPAESTTHDATDASAYTLHRILHGVPEGIIDIPPMSAFPMEANLDIMGGLDFRKGCYVGQELTVRTYHLGVLRKRILPVWFSNGPVQSNSEQGSTHASEIRALYSEESATPKPRIRGTGKLLSVEQGVGLALMRLEQVEAVEAGRVKFQVDSGNSGGPSNLVHWWPEWWPAKPVDAGIQAL